MSDAVQVQLPQFKGFAVDPSDIQQGEAETSEAIQVNSLGRRLSIPVRRRSMTITLKGLTMNEINPFLAQAEQNIRSMFNGSAPTETIDIGGVRLEDAVLVKATAKAPVYVENINQFTGSEVELEYHSQRWTA